VLGAIELDPAASFCDADDEHFSRKSARGMFFDHLNTSCCCSSGFWRPVDS
jgi:hypothetical protein